jgi:hypothetical protein
VQPFVCIPEHASPKAAPVRSPSHLRAAHPRTQRPRAQSFAPRRPVRPDANLGMLRIPLRRALRLPSSRILNICVTQGVVNLKQCDTPQPRNGMSGFHCHTPPQLSRPTSFDFQHERHAAPIRQPSHKASGRLAAKRYPHHAWVALAQ